MRSFFVATIAVLSLGLGHRIAHAAPDLVELAFGAGNVNAAIGNGGLTLGISHLGEVSVLTWPSPSYTDQLLHLGSNAPDRHDAPTLMAHPAMGATLVLVVTTEGAQGAGPWVEHLNTWATTQRYPDPLTPRVETTYTHAELGLRVQVHDLVRPDADVWARHVEIVRQPDSPVPAGSGVRLIAYHNLSPTLSRVPQLPLADWAMDAYNDYAAIWDADAQQLTHFRPEGHGDLDELLDLVSRPAIDYGAVGEILRVPRTPEAIAALSARLSDDEAAFGPGAYLVLAASSPVTGVQVGFDDTPTCELVDTLVDNVQALPELLPGIELPLDPAIADVLRCERSPASIVAENGWVEVPRSAFTDLADGSLEGSHLAAGQVDTALIIPLAFARDRAEVTLTLAAAETASKARALSMAHRALPFSDHLEKLVDHWHPILGRAALPTGVSDRLLEVCQRALMNLLVAQDKHSGAIVASIARQAPYGLDWPRDGAFFNVALDVAGLTAQASAHGRFTMATQRLTEVGPELLINTPPPPDPDDPDRGTYPAGAWEMNYYADGLVGGNIRWEIDNTGLALWGLIDHLRYLEGQDKADWRTEIWPTVERGADLLARWRDPATGLHAPAFEDDNHLPTQTLHGAITTWLALDRAAGLAQDLGEVEHATRWQTRAEELEAAIRSRLMDPDTGLFIEGLDEALNPGNAAGGPSAWALWPAGFELASLETVSDWLLDLADERLRLDHGGGAYIPKILVAVAKTDRREATQTRIKDLLERLAKDTATPDTAIFGEVFVAVDDDDDGTPDRFSARVSKPHVWAGVLTYLSAMALTRPERFDSPLAPTDPTDPADPADPEDPVAEGGSGCQGGPQNLLGLLGLLPLVLASLVSRWRRRRTASVDPTVTDTIDANARAC